MKVKLSWVKSVSADVVNQELTSSLNNGILVETLGKDVESKLFDLSEGDVLVVSLRASNGVKFSVPVSASFSVPVVVAPEAPTNLVFEVVE